MARIKLIIEYDGSRYHGFQYQSNADTVQNRLMQAICKLTGETASPIVAASRTDTGVHALGQVVVFNSNSTIPASRWRQALNSCLPEDIKVRESCLAPDDFNPRFQALSKKYVYQIYRSHNGATFMRHLAWCLTGDLNVEKMQQAGHFVEGYHNFSAFSASGSPRKTMERTIFQCRLVEKEDFLRMEIVGDGFLYNMVRIIMGTLAEVGQGTKDPEDIPQIIASQDRTQAGITAPPQGLYLVEVNYPPGY